MSVQVSVSYYQVRDGVLDKIRHDGTVGILTGLVKDALGDTDSYPYAMLDSMGGSTGTWMNDGSLDREMILLSKIYPDIVFCVHVVDDNDDEWEVWFKKGKMQTCCMIKTFEPVDLEKLL